MGKRVMVDRQELESLRAVARAARDLTRLAGESGYNPNGELEPAFWNALERLDDKLDELHQAEPDEEQVICERCGRRLYVYARLLKQTRELLGAPEFLCINCIAELAEAAGVKLSPSDFQWLNLGHTAGELIPEGLGDAFGTLTKLVELLEQGAESASASTFVGDRIRCRLDVWWDEEVA